MSFASVRSSSHFRFNVSKNLTERFRDIRSISRVNRRPNEIRIYTRERACTWLHNARLGCKISKQRGSECSQLSGKLNFVQLPECYVIYIYTCARCLLFNDARVTHAKRERRGATPRRCGSNGSNVTALCPRGPSG